MPALNKPKPPNAFFWFARYIADMRKSAGRPFRSVNGAIHDAARQWHELGEEGKADWKEKARSERVRFRSDPALSTMTPKEFLAQACETSANGMLAGTNFWSRHWANHEREQYAEELDLLEHFDTRKRSEDRSILESHLSWKFSEDRSALLSEQFLFISVQSSSPVEAETYMPETLAIASFSVKEGIVPYSEFSCGIAPDIVWTNVTRRTGSSCTENNVGDEDGCQARVGLQAVAKLIFQRAQRDPGAPQAPVFFCLAEEFEVVYDALCDMKSRISSKLPQQLRHLSVKQVATIEDLFYCLLNWHKIELPRDLWRLQNQLYFDTLMERTDRRLVASLRCGAHESDSITRCPLSVIRLAALKIKEWLDNGGIPPSDLRLIERQPVRQFDWPVFPDHDTEDYGSDDDENDGVKEAAAGWRDSVFRGGSSYDMTLAWVNSQSEVAATVRARDPGQPAAEITNELAFQRRRAPVREEPQRESVQNAIQNGLPQVRRNCSGAAVTRLLSIVKNQQRILIAGTELEHQHRLPYGARGIGRGMQMIPTYAEKFHLCEDFMKS